MRFLLTRSSDAFHNKKPCEEAEWGKYYYTDERTVCDPAEVGMYRGQTEWWYKHGFNHRIENGHIKRDIEEEGWTLELVSLEDVISLCRRVGHSLIVNTVPCLEIEIYDDYRE